MNLLNTWKHCIFPVSLQISFIVVIRFMPLETVDLSSLPWVHHKESPILSQGLFPLVFLSVSAPNPTVTVYPIPCGIKWQEPFVVRWPHVPRGKCGLGASHMQEGKMGGINVPQSNTICQDILWFRFHRLYVPTRLQGQSLSARMAPYRVFQMRAVYKYPLPVPASLSSLNSCLPLHTLSLLHTKERLV